MIKLKRLTEVLLAVVMLVSVSGCTSGSKDVTEVQSVAVQEDHTIVVSDANKGAAHEEDPRDQRAKDYEWNVSRTFVVGEVSFHNDPSGYTLKGMCTEGRGVSGVKCNSFACDARGVYAYYNYDRLVKTALADEGAIYSYFSLDGVNWNGGGAIDKFRSECEPGSYFDGSVTDEIIESLASRDKAVEYWFYIDWRQQDRVKEGDTVLMVIDPVLTVNPNYLIPEYQDTIKTPKSYSAVVAPFPGAFEGSFDPYIVQFVDGKLQLPAELPETFALRRLYDDTDPELTGIKDGDSIETVVAFLKAVEQDMIRYEEEMRQQPITTDVSSIR